MELAFELRDGAIFLTTKVCNPPFFFDFCLKSSWFSVHKLHLYWKTEAITQSFWPASLIIHAQPQSVTEDNTFVTLNVK